MAIKGSCMCGDVAYQFTGEYDEVFGPSGGVLTRDVYRSYRGYGSLPLH